MLYNGKFAFSCPESVLRYETEYFGIMEDTKSMSREKNEREKYKINAEQYVQLGTTYNKK